jgi:hypothetical protein
MARLGAVLPPPAGLGGAGGPMCRLRGDRPVGGAAAAEPVRRRLPRLPGPSTALGTPLAEPLPVDSAGGLSCPWRSAAWGPILDHVNLLDLLADLLGWFADLLAPLGEHLVHRRAGHAITQGRLGCSFKVMSGRQQGLSLRWRRGAVMISPGAWISRRNRGGPGPPGHFPSGGPRPGRRRCRN